MYLFTSMCNNWFLYFHIIYLVYVIEVLVFVNTEHCAEILNLICLKQLCLSLRKVRNTVINYLHKVWRLFNMRSFQCCLYCIFAFKANTNSNQKSVIPLVGKGGTAACARSPSTPYKSCWWPSVMWALLPHLPDPAPGARGGATSSAQSPEWDRGRGPFGNILWVIVPVPREESVGGHWGRSLGPGSGGVSFRSEAHPYSLLSSSDLLAAFCSFKPQGYF